MSNDLSEWEIALDLPATRSSWPMGHRRDYPLANDTLDFVSH